MAQKNESGQWFSDAGFSMIEMLVVILILIALMGLLMPSIKGIKSAGDFTKATYDIAGVLEVARSYALTNNTYVWVGFFEEDAATSSATTAISGTGRIVVSIVASKDGTNVNAKSFGVGTSTPIDPAQLIQVGNLVKIENAHLKNGVANDPIFPLATGTGTGFAGRPLVSSTAAQYGDVLPTDKPTPFQYPVSASGGAQYLFSKVLQFSPRGEACVATNYGTYVQYALTPVIEIGLQPTHGTQVDTANPNVAAVQIGGMLGKVKIYRR